MALTCNGTVVRCNRRCEEIFGYPQGSLAGISLRTLFPADEDCRLASERTRTAPAQQQGLVDERLMQHKSGAMFWCGIMGQFVDAAEAEGTGTIVWVFQDIDEHKRAEMALADAHQELEGRVEQRAAKLDAANRQLQAEMQERRRIEDKHRRQQAELAHIARVNTAGEMVSALAHELGQPLAAALNYAHGCLLRLASANVSHDELKHGLIQTVRNTEQAGEIVRRVRRFLHKQAPERRLCDINQILDEIVTFLEPEARRLEITLRIRSCDTALKAMVDRVEIEQIVVNLVKNAFEAMADTPAPRSVEISSLANADDTLTIAVADSGPGVPPYLRTSVFEPFFTTKNKGMGFGLAICSSLIEPYGGTIRVDEGWLGGALFEIILPRGDQA